MNSQNLIIYEFDELYKILIEIKKDININFEKASKNQLSELSSKSNSLIFTKNKIPGINNQIIFDKLNVKKYTKMKSSLKFCVIATGEFDGYVAEPRACEWDIAAGHAILKHSGGTVTDFENNEILYGKKDFKNPSLILKSNMLV